MSTRARSGADHERSVRAARLLTMLHSLRAGAANPRLQRYSLLVAAVVLAVGLFVALRRLPPDLGLTRPGLLALSAGVGVPVAVLLTVIETWLSARIVKVRFSWWSSLRVSVLASAANMLPLPGGPLVRVSVLKRAGAGLTSSTATTVLVATSWLGVAFLFAAFSAKTSFTAIALGFAAIGTFLTVGSAAGIYYLCRSWRLLSSVLLIKCAIVVVDLYRMRWALGSLEVETGMRETAIFSISGVAGAAVSFVPAGLGVTEAAAALVAPISGIASSAAFLAAALNRAAALAVMLPLALAVSATSTSLRRD